jgi:membrane associated rhomboid family serine protease
MSDPAPSDMQQIPNPPPENLSPDEARDAFEREVRLARVLKGNTPLTWMLLGVNVLIWVAALGWGDTLGIRTPYFNNSQLVLFTGMKVNELLADGQWWRLISSQFVHLGFMHIAFNAYGLYVLGPMVERFYGWKRFLLLYLSSGTAGALASYFFVDAHSGGASGAIYGLVGVLLVFGFKYRRELPKRVSKALTFGMLPWVIFSLGIGFLESLPMDNAAHLGGLFCGGLLVFVLSSKLRPARAEDRSAAVGEAIVWVLTILAIVALVWTGFNWSQEVARCVTDGSQQYFQCYPKLEAALAPD